MKFFISIILGLLISGCNRNISQRSSFHYTVFAKNVLETIVENDISKFLNLAVTPAEMVKRLEAFPEKNNDSFLKFSRKKILNMWLNDLAKMPDAYYTVILKGQKENIVWKKVLFERAEIKLINNSKDMADHIDILFVYNKKLYKIRLDDCIKLPRGWLMGDKIIWKGRIQ